ncbi:MAG: nucleotidyltransferase family protein [Deltaproteobacteria bacterium]|nr:nucleotidyltransferase family protein [Deltaproteobacteria bacterium]
MADLRLAALIPAAGFSRRMKAFKPLLKIDGTTIIERAIALFQSVGIHDIVTVVGHRSDELIPVLEKTAAHCVINQRYHDGMFSSIQRGVQELKQHCDAFFLLPVDIPLVHSSTILRLLEAFKSRSSTLICSPHYNNRQGHPPLIDSCLIDEILTYGGHGGLRSLLRKYEDKTHMVAVSDRHVLMDIDTQADLALLRNTAF